MSLLDVNLTRIEPCREVCDVNAFKIATSLIMTGVELPGQLATRSKMQKCIQSCLSVHVILFKIFQFWPSRSSGEMGARAGFASSQYLCFAWKNTGRCDSPLDRGNGRSSGEPTWNHKIWSLRSSGKTHARANRAIPDFQIHYGVGFLLKQGLFWVSIRSGITLEFCKKLVFYKQEVGFLSQLGLLWIFYK